MLFLVNPPRRKGRKVAVKRRKAKKRRKLTAAQKRAGFGGKRAMTKTRRKAVKRRTTKTRRKTTVARKRKSTRKRTTRRATTRRRRSTKRRTSSMRFTRVKGAIYRKNPFGGRIVTQLVEGAKGAGAVVIGKAAGRTIANMLPLPKDTVVGSIGAQLASALLLGMVGRRFLPANIANYVFVGALTAPVETGLKMIPGVSGFLGEDPFLPIGENPFLPMGAYPSIEAYPEGLESEFGY